MTLVIVPIPIPIPRFQCRGLQMAGTTYLLQIRKEVSCKTNLLNLLKHLRWSVFAQTVNGLKSLNGHAKTLHVLRGSEYASAEKQDRCTVS